MVEIYSFIFLVTHIQCLCDHKIVGKWLKLHNYEELSQYFAPILWSIGIIFPWCLWYFSGWILVQLHQFPFLGAQIQCLGDQKIWRITTIFFSHLVEYGYRFTIKPLVFFLWILVQIHQFPFLVTHIQCLSNHKVVGKWL